MTQNVCAQCGEICPTYRVLFLGGHAMKEFCNDKCFSDWHELHLNDVYYYAVPPLALDELTRVWP